MALGLTEKDKSYMRQAQQFANNHDSGSTYDMVAMYAKGSLRLLGGNQLNRPANTISELYPDWRGVHAELDLWLTIHKMDREIRGGTVYVAGKKSQSKICLSTTKPCVYCAAILVSTKINFVVFYHDRTIKKMKVSDLLAPLNHKICEDRSQ